jgi:hypothetical protein
VRSARQTTAYADGQVSGRAGATGQLSTGKRRPAIAWSAAGTLHPSLKVRGRPILGQPASEEKLDDVGLGLSDSTGRYACFQTAARLGVRLFLVSIGHLRSLYGLLKNDYELFVFSSNSLIVKLIIQRVNFTDFTQTSRGLIETDQSSQNVNEFRSAHPMHPLEMDCSRLAKVNKALMVKKS